MVPKYPAELMMSRFVGIPVGCVGSLVIEGVCSIVRLYAVLMLAYAVLSYGRDILAYSTRLTRGEYTCRVCT